MCYPESDINRNIVEKAVAVVFFVKECDRTVIYEEEKRLHLLSFLSQDFELWLQTFLL
jgi:hypothetical protein